MIRVRPQLVPLLVCVVGNISFLLLVVTAGCAAPTVVDESSGDTKPEPAPDVTTTLTVHDEDAIVPLYSDVGSSSERRFLPPPAAEPTVTPARTESDSDTTTTDRVEPERRTSMPSREATGKKPRAGGVRKAVPVHHSAAALFGKWRIDTAQSTVGFVDADSILFLGDGRMRVWKSGKIEDGRWTWTEQGGVKTGGIDGVPISLGSFEVVAGSMIVSLDKDQRFVLVPDRIFVAPAPVLPKTPTP